MTSEQHQALNKILGDKHGTIPYGDEVGQPVYQFKRMRELKMPYQNGSEVVTTASGLFVTQPKYEWRSQADPDDDRWCIAKWNEPESHDEWLRKYANLEWQKHGYWHCWQPLESGKEPTEEWTRWIADHIIWQGSMSLREHVIKTIEGHKKREEEYKGKVRDITRDHFVNHVPGKRGGSYLSFNEESGKGA